MRAITLTQPWAGLVMAGIKLVENRPRPIIKNSDIVEALDSGVPLRIAIHASREIDVAVYEWIARNDNCCDLWAPGVPHAIDGASEWYRLSQIKSSMLGTIDVTGALYIGGCSPVGIANALSRVDMLSQLRFTFGPTVYTLAKPRVLKEPVPCRGKLGFWKVDPDLVGRVAA